MKPETEYKYRKRITELEEKINRMDDDLREFRSAASVLYDQCTTNLSSNITTVRIATILEVLKRVWRPFI